MLKLNETNASLEEKVNVLRESSDNIDYATWQLGQLFEKIESEILPAKNVTLAVMNGENEIINRLLI